MVAPATASGAGDPSSAWFGRWTLDDTRSDPPEQMLDVMEVPWYLKAVAIAFTPSFRIERDGSGLVIDSKTPLGSRRQRLTGDGDVQEGEDALGRAFRETSRWGPDGSILVHRETDLPSGKVARVDTTWRVEDDLLSNQMEVKVGDGKPFPYRRVFARKTDGD